MSAGTLLAVHLFICILGLATSGKLLLILFDGFRWDYVEQQGVELPAFHKIFQRGVRVKKLIPAYPSKSYPNYYTLATGLYAESHGIVGNTLYDVTTRKTYTPLDNMTSQERSAIYDDAEPLWITAEKQGKTSYMYYWIGCEAVIQGRQPTYCRKYIGKPSLSDFRDAVDDSMALFRNSSADLAMIYHEDIDDLGHRHGPLSHNVNSALRSLDSELDRMLTKIAEYELENEVDVMIFADHGMTTISPTSVTNVSDVIPPDSIDVIINDYGANVYIWPKEGRVQEVYTALRNHGNHYKVYLKDDIPDSWHIRSHPRMPPVLLVADQHWYIDTPNFGYYYYPDTGPMVGIHGYAYDPDEPDMASIFAAFGPSFVPEVVIDSLPNVNLYQVMCSILHVQPRPHNGSWSRVSHMMKDVTSSATTVPANTLLILIVLSCTYCSVYNS